MESFSEPIGIFSSWKKMNWQFHKSFVKSHLSLYLANDSKTYLFVRFFSYPNAMKYDSIPNNFEGCNNFFVLHQQVLKKSYRHLYKFSIDLTLLKFQ
jgi:hypothetical protein